MKKHSSVPLLYKEQIVPNQDNEEENELPQQPWQDNHRNQSHHDIWGNNVI